MQNRFAEFLVIGAPGDQATSYGYKRRRRQHRSHRRMKEMIMFEVLRVAAEDHSRVIDHTIVLRCGH
jgi:ribosomal protein L32